MGNIWSSVGRPLHALAQKEFQQAEKGRDERREALDKAWAELGNNEPWTDASLDAALERAAAAEKLLSTMSGLNSRLDALWSAER